MICNRLDEKLNSENSSTSLIKFVKDRPGHDKRYAIDSTKMRSELHWTPEHDIESGLAKTIDWYLSNQDWLDKLSEEAIVKNRFSS